MGTLVQGAWRESVLGEQSSGFGIKDGDDHGNRRENTIMSWERNVYSCVYRRGGLFGNKKS